MTDRQEVTGSPSQSTDATSEAGRRKQQISTDRAPQVGGSYSQGIRAGDFIFLSGQTPRNRDRMIINGSFEDQVRRTLENLAAVAAAAGASLADAVKVNVYLQR
jgi:2-iminobutanoate/2-iminopropanoate deaminase